jgi:uncharacterized protein YbjT (DUF2867 family)
MNVLVVGATGKTGRFIIPLLKAAGHTPRAMIRNFDQREEMEALGAECVAGDLEKPMGHAVKGNWTVLFAAGSGSSTGPEKTIEVDFHGAISLIETSERMNVRRFIMLSAMNTDDPDSGPENLQHYLHAKAGADARLRLSLMNWTIVRPGYLHDEPSHELLGVAPSFGPIDKNMRVSREDVAKVMVACMALDNTIGKTFDMIDGKTPMLEALESL